MIPKIIHYCWLSDDPVPIELENYMETWKKKLHGYQFIKWNFERFNKEKSVWVKEAFDNKKYAFAADYIRLYALYTYGGIYLDMDMEVLKSFDDLLDRQYFMAHENPGASDIEAACMGFEPYNSYLAKCLEYYQDRHFVKDNGEFDTLTLPKIMKKIAVENSIQLECFDWQTFTCKSFNTGFEYPVEHSYTIHHFAGSWLDKKLQSEIALRRNFSKKYGKYGELLFKLYKYGLHPWKIISLVRRKLKSEKGSK